MAYLCPTNIPTTQYELTQRRCAMRANRRRCRVPTVPEVPSAAEPVRPAAPPATGSGSVDSQKTVISKRLPASAPAFVRAANPFEMGSALAGEQLGHFQLEEFVGGGGMGAVFRATDTMLGRTVAVKVVSRDETNEETLRRFRNEAQSAARLDHPNIARVYYVGEDKGWNYIVFEYIEGVNVRDLVEHNGPLSLEDAIKYTLQMAEALEHASQRDVTHRDIKPSNILIMIDGRAKLVDMGLARLHQVESSTEDLTASGVTLGTFDYISPEQARDPRNTDVRSDLYSLGCTLFYMLTGQPPFPEGTVLQKLLSHSSEEPPDVLTYRPELPGDIAAVVKKLLAKLPEQRFQSPRDLIGELLLLADRLNLTAITASSTVWLAPSQPKVAWWVRHVPWLAPAGVLALVVLMQTWLDSARDVPIPLPPRLALRPEAEAGDDNAAGGAAGKQPPGKAPAKTLPGEPAVQPKVSVVEPPGPSNKVTLGGDRQADGDTAGASDKAAPGTAKSPPGAPAAPQQSKVALAADTQSQPVPTGADAAQNPPRVPDRSDRPAVDSAALGAQVADDRTPTMAVTDPHILVVSDEDVRLDRSMLCVRSLEEAIDQAAELSGVDEIQLRFNGIRTLRPIDLDLDRFAQGKLTIRPADGFSPIIACEGNQDRAASAEPSAMIRVHHGRLAWLNTHFFFQFSPASEDLAARSLFQLDAVNAVEFSRCSFTIRNLGSDGLPAARAVALFDLMPVDQLAGLLYDFEPLGDTPAIRLTDCVARGQATLVRSEQAVPFWLTWEHGLFISSEQIVDVGGAMVQPPWAMGRVTLGLKRLLVFADRGICLVRTDSNAPYPAGVTVKSQACLFATRLTKPATPLYLFRGSSPLSSDGSQLVVSGSNNFYKNTKVVLRVESSGDNSTLEEYTFDDLQEREGQVWYNERNPLPATVFSWLPPAHSVDRQKLDDFIEPGSGEGWFMRDLEIAPTELPRFPDYSSLLPRVDLRLPQPSGQVVPNS